MKPRLILSFPALGALALSACATTQVQTQIAPIPLDPGLRAACALPALPAEPVTPADLAQFSLAQEQALQCESARALKLIEVIEAHNRSAR